jgi:PPK2 family polyphosphate:nucleotide phosphotransferase
MIKLNKISTKPPIDTDKEALENETRRIAKEIGVLQEKMYAEGKHSLLVVFQGMDASGKDGSTQTVFQNCSPLGAHAFAFKKPTDLEFDHDFLWRIHKEAPAKGMIKIFNRSHYEDILIQWVRGWIDDKKAKNRMASINAFEQLLAQDNGTTILKFYMHISPERQMEKLQERIDDPEKNWKHNPADWEERKLWDKYMKCYEYAINNSTIPWIIAPVDSRTYRNYFIAKTVLDTLKKMRIKLPLLEKK